MKTIRVVKVKGRCNAGLEVGDTLFMDGLALVPRQDDKVCYVALASIMASIGRLSLSQPVVCVSCPDPATGAGGNVIFEIS
ncbi:MAG: TIGR04076 family protein [Anaerolineae bacterium]|nr:TIGR04076 family protein [Anaerolineae bacterium]